LRPAANIFVNPGGSPEWFEWRDSDGMVNFFATSLYGTNDDAMAYAVTYICLEEDTTITLAGGSDDTYQILVDNQEVWIYTVDRAWTGYVDVTAPITLTAGIHLLMVKVFNSGGGWSFGVKIRDEIGQPFASGVKLTLDPQGCGTTPPPIAFKRGDVNADGTLNIADAIKLLGHLFAREAAPTCQNAADANDDGTLNIADAIKILSHLFAATGPLPAPFPNCGPDPTDPGKLPECNFPAEKCPK
jgi:hypothetical protein